ncbi:hypothetical protein QO002_005584 [Pararhizobium capsulatum DSM 1112]|uniref:Uncharacterized protein n=1 Tax=Pararhizobium capsulatum DSM 1112 TaxID=1121113 RepID=A0ABU0BZJ4_9HYPH|nr:hypothetical protein [Pararhizobium capsulatum DSM 1112]
MAMENKFAGSDRPNFPHRGRLPVLWGNVTLHV